MRHIPSAFVDSDVIISSLISSKGAAYILLNKISDRLVVSSQSVQELERVVTREKMSLDALHATLSLLRVVPLTAINNDLVSYYSTFVLDPDDSHIVAGAVVANVKFLITYNTRHFSILQIKNKFNITVLKPGNYLQYLRSINGI